MANTIYKTAVTEPGVTTLLINAVDWTLVSLQLNSAGPVIIGNLPQLGPISAGVGVQLGTQIRYMLLGPGERLYVYSDSNDTIGAIYQSLPFLVGNALTLLKGMADIASLVTGRVISNPGKKC